MEASAASGAAPGTRGQIGRQTFDMAHALIQDGKKPTEAFNIVAGRTGRSAATVATAYYRIARTMPDGAGVKQRPRSGRPSSSTRARASRTVRKRAGRATGRAGAQGATTSQLVRQLVDAAAALSAHVERLERENADYRTITDALDRLSRT